jgi:hypothetical protein
VTSRGVAGQPAGRSLCTDVYFASNAQQHGVSKQEKNTAIGYAADSVKARQAWTRACSGRVLHSVQGVGAERHLAPDSVLRIASVLRGGICYAQF